MPSNLPYKQAANVERRTWDKEAYEARARARDAAAKASASASDARPTGHDRKRPIGSSTSTALDAVADPIKAALSGEVEKEEFVPAARGAMGPERSDRAFLKSRRGKIDLESKLGSTEIINAELAANSGRGDEVRITDGVSKSSNGVGWHCKVCDCFLKDSMTYLDHINGRKHQRFLGYSMRAEKSTKSQVSNKLLVLAEGKRKAEAAAAEVAAAGLQGDDPAGDEFEVAVRKKDEEAQKRKADRAKRKEERKKAEQDKQKKEEEEMNGDLDPAMAAMMGFSGFGSSKK